MKRFSTKHLFISAAFFVAMCGATTVSAQLTNYNRVLVASGGLYEFAPPFSDFVTVKSYGLDGTIRPIDVIYTQSVQDIQGIRDESTFAVAAEDSLVFYTNYRRTRAFRLPDSFGSYHTLGVSGGTGGVPTQTLWAGKWYGGNSNYLFYYNDAGGINPQYGGTIAGIGHDVRGITVLGDTVYVSQNIQNANFSDSVSYIAKISNSNKIFAGNLGQNNPLFFGASELHTYNGKIHGVCLNSNRVIEYSPTTGATRAILCGTAAITKTLSFAGNRLTVVQGGGVLRYNITNGTLIQDLSCVTAAGESAVSGIDAPNGFGNYDGISTTDFATYGKTYLRENVTSCISTVFNVGIAPEAMEIDTNWIVNTHDRNDNSLFSLSPNPTADRLNIVTTADIQGDITIKIVDAMGRTVDNTAYNSLPSQISLADLPEGLYFVQIQTEKGFFVQKVERF